MQDENLKNSFWDFKHLSLLSLYACLLVLPLFYLPLWGTALEFSKKLFLLLFALAAMTFWVLDILKKGRLIIPKSCILALSLMVLVSSFVSTIFSGSFIQSFIGLGFELDTWLTLAVGFTLLFLTAIFFQTKKELWRAYFGLLAVALVLFSFQLAAIFYFNVDFGSLGLRESGVIKIFMESLLGKWHDLGAFLGLIVLATVIILDFFKVKKNLLRLLVFLGLLISLITLGLINDPFLWVIVGSFSVFIFAYKFYLNQKNKSGYYWSLSLILAIVCLAAFFLGSYQMINDQLALWRSQIGVPVFDVRPSWESSYIVTKDVLRANSFLGTGPNSFSVAWAKYKPISVNQSNYWNVDFRFGTGLIPSSAVSLGLVGFVLWLTFLATILGSGFYALFKSKIEDKTTKNFLFLSFISASYLWALAFFSVPGNYLFILSFIVTGFLVATLANLGLVKNLEISLPKKFLASYISVILFIMVVFFSVVGGYLIVKKYISVFTYHKSLYDLNKTGDLITASALLERVINLSQQDLYCQKNSELYTLQIKELLQKTDLPEEDILANFKTLFDSAAANAQLATKVAPQNYMNWLALGRVYASVVPLNIEGAYEEAVKAFNKALELSPNNPVILLNSLARLELAYRRPDIAQKYIDKTLTIRPNYVPAALSLAEIETNKGNLEVAIKILEDFYASYSQNTDADFLYQLGYLRYKNTDYKKAIDTLKKVVEMVPIHANARYFLGLSYDASGQSDLALENFRRIKITNPENTVIAAIIFNLENGRGALDGLAIE
ncbi:MAG: tetratricopeptide repeat protein [Candidatus Paceibacterota bacterium]|jgi:tetratricopeptide (TPR) repeat protein